MKAWSTFLVVFLLFGCGPDGKFQGQTTVHLTLDLPDQSGSEKASFAPDSVPSDIALVLVTVTAPLMDTVSVEVPVIDGVATIKLSVPNGPDRTFSVEVKNSSGVVLYTGSATQSLTGGTVSLPIQLSINKLVFATYTVMPQDALCSVGTTRQYTLEGKLTDGSTHNPADITWSSSVAAIPITNEGLVDCNAAGTSTITAFLAGEQIATTVLTVKAGASIVDVAAGGFHTCAALDDGTVQCWGLNVSGQLGDGTFSAPTDPIVKKPVKVGLPVSAVAEKVAAGGYHSCALHKDGSISCWGLNQFGQLGNDKTISTSTPVKVSGITNATAIAAGFDHTCAVLATGSVSCWGYNYSGQVGTLSGLNDSASAIRTPTPVVGTTNATATASFFDHTCFLKSNGEAGCWGYNKFGQLGGGSTATRSSPSIVIESATSIAAGGTHSCATLSTGTIQCWGQGSFGQLDGTKRPINNPNVLTPTSGPILKSPTTGVDLKADFVAAGGFHTCALLEDGSVQCWGFNLFGQLGNKDLLSSQAASVSIPITNPSGEVTNARVLSLSLGLYHTCAILENNTVRCWGQNSFGQLGNGTLTNSPTPVSPSDL